MYYFIHIISLEINVCCNCITKAFFSRSALIQFVCLGNESSLDCSSFLSWLVSYRLTPLLQSYRTFLRKHEMVAGR